MSNTYRSTRRQGHDYGLPVSYRGEAPEISIERPEADGRLSYRSRYLDAEKARQRRTWRRNDRRTAHAIVTGTTDEAEANFDPHRLDPWAWD